ncbi:MAG: glycine cleavage system protein GcvH [Puniceicoccaceae bacterium]|nr:glycine cleavage system protein GcvH [Puniceicoccaceae bacterium]
MSLVPEALLYTKDHEWIQLHQDGTATVGITDYAQESLGDITFVEFPLAGESFNTGDTFGVVESVKAASDLYMPLDAEVLKVNDEVDAEPELLNSDPYQKGWLLKISLTDASQVEALLKADAYAGII